MESPLISFHGMNDFLRPFVDEVNKLQDNGITVNLDQTEHHYSVGLLAILADNLAAHALGGFKESMSFAKRICRTCMTTSDNAKHHFTETEFQLRHPESHKQQCQELQDSSSYVELSRDYGINRASILESINDFSVVTSLPHDVMHDLLEGVIPYEMKLLLRHCISSMKYFTLVLFNNRLSKFDFGYSELGDKPALVDCSHISSPDKKIRQSASQMWLLAKILPFLIADLIPEDNQHWQCFTVLLRILEIAMAPILSRNSVDYLCVLIEEHHTLFRQLYPDESFIPKLHYMVHYPRQLLMFGPLVHSWTMRYESKLRVLKRISKVGLNFKNICQTVARRHQHLLVYHLHSPNYLTHSLEPGTLAAKVTPLASEPIYIRSYIQQMGASEETFVEHVRYVKFSGTTYKCNNAFVHYPSDVNDRPLNPQFAKLLDFFMFHSNIFVVLQIYVTQYFDSHYHAYVVSPKSDYVVHPFVSIDKRILHGRRLFVHPSSSSLYIAVKWYIE